MRNWRINLIFALIFLFGAVVIGRLFYLQIIKGDYYRALAQGQQRIFQALGKERGEIFFHGGQILATNIKGNYLFASPSEIKNKEEAAEKISSILKLDKNIVLEKLNKDTFLEPLKLDPTSEEEKLIKNLNLTGLYFKEGIFRKYPQGEMASQTIGFLGGEEVGQYGLEGYYDDILQGLDGGEKSDKGSDIILTLDYNIQFMAEKLLKEAKENLKIEGGQIVVLEPNSGKVLALASFPNFDPNYYFDAEDFKIFQNSATQKFFEPGSIFKPITMAGALDQGRITPQTTYVDEGEVKIGGYTIYNYGKKVWGERTMTEVLENSINTGAVFVERKLGSNLFLEYIEKFGLFEPTGIDLQGEVFSENKEFKKGYEINFATVSFGQGIEITPLQMARAFCAIANGGKMVKPYTVEKIVNYDKTKEIQPQISPEQVISLNAASKLTAMLVGVVENGFGKKAKIPGYYIAGKTGTAQVPWSALGVKKKGYSETTWQSFIGFAPAFSPKFLILVKLDNPQTNTAESSAVPIFKELAKYIIDYLEIPPDYE